MNVDRLTYAHERVSELEQAITSNDAEMQRLIARIAELEAAIKIFLAGGRDREGHHYPEAYIALRAALRGKEER